MKKLINYLKNRQAQKLRIKAMRFSIESRSGGDVNYADTIFQYITKGKLPLSK
jgi:hypothetical protein